MRNFKSQFYKHSMGLAVGVCLFLAGNIIYDTAINTKAPFRTEHDAAVITSDGRTSTFTYTRDLYILKTFEGEVSRHLSPSNSEYPQYTVLGSKATYVFKPEPYKVNRPFVFEPPLKKGVWCLHATMYWQPRFSIVQHSKEAAPVCAEVK